MSNRNTTSYMIGVDIGTTSTKAVLFQEDGRVVERAGREYPLYTPVPDSAEQDPEEIFSAVLYVVRQVMDLGGVSPSQILFVSFSSAMHSVIPVDADGRPLMRCLTWADNRSAGWSEKLRHELGGHEIYRRTGTPLHPMSPLTKLLCCATTCRSFSARQANLFPLRSTYSPGCSASMLSITRSHPLRD